MYLDTGKKILFQKALSEYRSKQLIGVQIDVDKKKITFYFIISDCWFEI